MDFSFGIITTNRVSDEILSSIRNQKIENYEIVIVGGLNYYDDENIIHVPFDERIKNSWITKKKNLITENSKYENIVFLHDYIKLDDNWYKGMLEFGNDFKICMNRILNTDQSRYRDWTLWPGNKDLENKFNLTEKIILNQELIFDNGFLVPYEINNLSKFMYISGAFFIVKKNIMIEYPLNEELSWGEGEDALWSLLVRKKYDFSMNEKSIVHLLKYKDRIFDEVSSESLEKIKKIVDE
jgi:hypothetical protein